MNSVSAPEPTPVTTIEYSRPALRWFELGLVLFVAFGQPILNSTYIALFGFSGSANSHGNVRYLSLATGEIGALLVLWYVLGRSGRTFQSLGIGVTVRGFLHGLGLATAALVTYYAAIIFLQVGHRLWFGQYAPTSTASNLYPVANLFVLVFFFLLNPLYEEVIVRGYVMTEIPELTGSMTLAIAMSVVTQTSYHLYQGWLAATSSSVGFLILSIYYARTRRLFPVIVAHAAIDLLAITYILSTRSH